MATASELMAAGVPASVANMVGGQAATGLVGVGTTAGTGLVLTSDYNVFATVSASSSAVLPTATGQSTMAIYNGGAGALQVFPNGTQNINGANSPFLVTNGKSALFTPAGNQWIANLSA